MILATSEQRTLPAPGSRPLVGVRMQDRLPQRRDGATETTVERRKELKPPSLYDVIFHNDDFTTMEFVIWVLVDIFDKTMDEATRLMFQVHEAGAACAGSFTREVAETKRSETLLRAEEHGMPLLVTLEQSD